MRCRSIRSQNGIFGDLRHPCEVVDLAGIPPGKERQRPPLAFRVDHREAPDRRKVSPPFDIDPCADATAVRRDHEGNRRVPFRAVPGRQDEVGPALPAVVRAVGDFQHAHGGRENAWTCRSDAGKQRDQGKEEDRPRGRALRSAHGSQNVSSAAGVVTPRNERLTARKRKRRNRGRRTASRQPDVIPCSE